VVLTPSKEYGLKGKPDFVRFAIKQQAIAPLS
jgi:hypothetical protein